MLEIQPLSHKYQRPSLRRFPFRHWLALIGLMSLLLGSATQAAVVYFMIQDASTQNSPFGTHRWKVEYEDSMQIDGFDLFTAVFGNPESLGNDEYRLGAADGNHVLMTNFGTADEPNYVITTITMNGVSLTNTVDIPYVPSWSQFVDGGSSGYPIAEPDEDLGEWDYGSGMSSPYRYFTDGSFEAYIYGGWNLPSSAPSVSDFENAPIVYIMVPEPRSWALIGIGVAAIGMRRRRKGRGYAKVAAE